MTQQQVFPHAELLRKAAAGFFTHKGSACLGEVSLRQMRTVLEEVIGHDNAEHRIAEKFKPLVAAAGLLVFIGIGGMGHGIAKQGKILKMVADGRFQLLQIRLSRVLLLVAHAFSSPFRA